MWAWTSSLSCFINLIQAAEHTFGLNLLSYQQCYFGVVKNVSALHGKEGSAFSFAFGQLRQQRRHHITHLWGQWTAAFTVRDMRFSLLCPWHSEYHIKSHHVIYLPCCRGHFHRIVLKRKHYSLPVFYHFNSHVLKAFDNHLSRLRWDRKICLEFLPHKALYSLITLIIYSLTCEWWMDLHLGHHMPTHPE